MSSLEIIALVGGILGSVTVCCVKLLHQIQNSKCSTIRCCGSECIRDVSIDHPEASTSKESEMVPMGNEPNTKQIKLPGLTDNPTKVSQLRRVYSRRLANPPAKYNKPSANDVGENI